MPIEPRRTKCYPVPPVCTAFWSPEDWERTAFYVEEPLTIEALGETWVAVDRDERGQLLYARQTTP